MSFPFMTLLWLSLMVVLWFSWHFDVVVSGGEHSVYLLHYVYQKSPEILVLDHSDKFSLKLNLEEG